MAIPDQRKRKQRRLWLLAGAVTACAVCLIPRRWLTVNDVTTGQTPAYPDLKPHVYAADVPAVRGALESACASLPRWRLMDRDVPEGEETFHAEVRTALFGFVDDVTIWLEPLPSESSSLPYTRVVIRSHSRVGRGDLGENARHIQALQTAMDAHLTAVAPAP
ncbi:MAG TPA: DUF1499 domain-containing protein [Chthonomonadaceae bacterium]|nr:DUF1499 domain-containing protein [Chthonomonadaceae bacterium]